MAGILSKAIEKIRTGNEMKDKSKAFDFEYWRDLAKKDPDAFEQKRAEAIEAFLTDVPSEELKRRLRGLQWRVEIERKRSYNAMDSAIRIYDMMWDSVARNYEELQKLAAMLDPSMDSPAPEQQVSAKVLPFNATKQHTATVG